MNPKPLVASLALAVLVLAGCSSGPTVVPAATAEQKKALWEPVAALAGEWMATDEKGEKHLALRIHLTSNKTIVHEVMFPGTEHEMTNVYCMDGPDLIMTHYCAAGNQPRLRATAAGSSAGEINFECDAVTNMRAKDEGYMGSMKLVIKDADHIEQWWAHVKEGKDVEGGEVRLTLERKK